MPRRLGTEREEKVSLRERSSANGRRVWRAADLFTGELESWPDVASVSAASGGRRMWSSLAWARPGGER
jgi:hypothetical protein